MLFAIWSENRATEEDASTNSPRDSIHTLSRQNTIANIPPGDQDDIAEIKDAKDIKPEVDETLGTTAFEDRRPAVFKSTTWEVCCVLALVSAQLTNVVHFRGGTNDRNWLMRNRLLFLL
jgi:hypothetical protein